MGRVTGHKQTTDGTAYSTGYTYNLGGALVEETYPSGRVVKNALDADGDLSIVQSKKNANSGYFNYAKNFTYASSGAVTSMQLGNGKWESTTFNSRLQPTQIALGTVQNGTDKLKLNYTYGTTTNNGNVLTQTITVPGMTFPLVQNYTYDELNRLKTATETNNASQTWTQVFGYDRYGNRNITSGTGVTNLTFNTANNRITNAGYSFDNAGNTTADGTGKTFTYDSENKQKTAVVNGYTNEYFYDGDGKRVKKVVPSTGETTIFVYDAAGKLVAEYSTIVAAAQDAKVAYLTADHLGSPRINTDANGNVIARHDYHPFGEEIYTAQRTTGLNYTADTVRKQFTGYERDIESDLDFAQARYYNKNHGRFHSVDPEGAGAYEENPQSWNAYAYVGNNPLNFTDPDGEKWKVCDNQGNCTEISDKDAKNTLFNRSGNHPEIIRKDGKIFDEDGNVSGTYVRTSFDDLSDEGNALIFGPNSIGEQGIKKGKLVGALAGGAVLAGGCIALCGPAAAVAVPFALKAGFGLIKFGGKNLKIRPDVVLKGGRSGQNVKNLVSEANSVVRGAKQGRVYVTDQSGKVILDITKDRVKEVGSRGFVKGGERPPTAEEIQLIKSIWK